MILNLNSQKQNTGDIFRFFRAKTFRLLVASMLFAGMQLTAGPKLTGITVIETNATLPEIFRSIEKQTTFLFFYDKVLIQKAAPVTVNLKNVTLEHALSECLKNQALTYTIVKNTIVVQQRESNAVMVNFQPPVNTGPPPVEVHGTVRDENGNPLSNASITIKGTNKGVTTNANGSFSIEVPDAGTVLVFSYTGYASQEIRVGNQNTISLNLQRANSSLNEVVVTALGISREKKSLSYAVTEVAGSDLTKAREINLGTSLSGRVAGVNASSTATGPGGASRVIIRGNGSLSGDNQPLYVVNGVPINNSTQSSAGTYGGVDRGDGLMSINPDDVESISVLKGGTAAALYGSRAANGVILITTKSSTRKKGLGVEFNSTYTVETPLSSPEWQYEYGSGSRGLKPTSQSEAVANGRISWGAKLDGSAVIQPDGVARPYSAQKNNIRNFYDNGTTFSNTLALSGGNKDANFRFSVSNMDNHGIVPNSSINRKIFNLNANAALGKRIIFEGNAQFNIEENRNRTYIADFTKNPNASVGLVATNIDVRTLAPGYDQNGYETPWSDYVFVVNPYFAANKVKNTDDRKRFIGSFLARYNITDHFYARGRVGIDYSNIDWTDINPTGLLYQPEGSMSTATNTTYETNVEGIIGFDKSFGHFSVNAIAGGNQMYNQVKDHGLASGLFNVPFDYFISNGKSQTFTQGFRESAINSLFASADIGFNNYLYLTLTGRQDWFSTLSFDNNSLFYPSAGLSYVFSQNWDKKPSWLSYGKVRASWAQVGGGAPNPYGLQLTYTAQSAMHLGQPLMGITGNTIPNSLKPYTSTTTEAGIELRMFNSRLGADLTVYDRTTTNDIVNATVPVTSGYTSVLLNVGEMRNRGIEVLLTGTPLRASEGLNWSVSYNMAYNDNKVIKIADGLTSLALPGAIPRTNNAYIYHYEGRPFGMIAGFRMKRDDKGNIVYNNANGLPLQSAIMPLGKGVPPLTMGLSNDFEYKNFSLGFLIDGKFGGSMYTSTNAYGTYFGLDKRTVENNVRETAVSVTGVDQNGDPFSMTVPAQDYYQGIAYSITDQFVYDASFVKLRQLTIGYSLPSSVLGKTPFQGCTLSFVARNLLLLYSALPNVDPESNYNNSNAQGLENFGVPTTRSYGLNLSVRF